VATVEISQEEAICQRDLVESEVDEIPLMPYPVVQSLLILSIGTLDHPFKQNVIELATRSAALHNSGRILDLRIFPKASRVELEIPRWTS
jgi:hypothetical protein